MLIFSLQKDNTVAHFMPEAIINRNLLEDLGNTYTESKGMTHPSPPSNRPRASDCVLPSALLPTGAVVRPLHPHSVPQSMPLRLLA